MDKKSKYRALGKGYRDSLLYALDGKPMNSRKRKVASKKVMENLLLAKLLKDGVISKTDYGFEIEARDNLKNKYEGKVTLSDILSVIHTLIKGLYSSGTDVKINGIMVKGRDIDGVVGEDNRIKDFNLRRALRDIEKRVNSI